jgi:hypothetical protein
MLDRHEERGQTVFNRPYDLRQVRNLTPEIGEHTRRVQKSGERDDELIGESGDFGISRGQLVNCCLDERLVLRDS